MSLFSSTNDNHWQKLLMKAGFALLVMGAVFLLILSVNQIRSGQYIGEADRYQNTINVSGEGEVFAIPDTAEFTFTVTQEAESVSEAQSSVTERSNNITSFLRENGIEEADLKTVGYNVQPRYERQGTADTSQSSIRNIFPPEGQRVLVGYEVSQTTRVKVRDTSQVGNLLSGIGQREVSGVSNVSFTVEDREEVREEARNEAITDAREEAQELADQLGVRLGEVVNFNESTDQPRVMYDTAAIEGAGGDAAASTPQISPGENRITSNVNITYTIK